MIGELIRCIQCNEVMNATEWDSCPEYIWDSGEIKEIEMSDKKAFLQKHKRHEIEELTPVSTPVSDKPYIEPIKTCYFEATNGNETFLIKRWRSTIDSPFAYEIIGGRIETSTGKVQVQTDAIEKQMRIDNDSHISEEKVGDFIKVVQSETEKLDPEKLEISAEGDTPLVSYYKLDNDCVDRILTRCQHEFEQRELDLLRDFVLRHNQCNDVMTLVVEKRLSIKS